ncbi:ABC transporter substrate-binding protein [Clostridium thermarum]|uniref:ABC transporter substrate-binding protein n=1 Tax=Clostridium thermarum TaxID=1716543 RepID=UPI0013D47DFE|nr:extracellular solute-binding protein [Clostridium thermarum]
MKKRLSLLLLSAVLAVSSLAGCKKTEEPKDTPTTTPTTTPTESTEKHEKVTIKIGMWPEDTNADQIELFNNYKLLCESKYDWITVEPAHYKYSVESFIPLAESGQLPTVFETWFTEPQKLIANGYVADITEQLKANGWYDSMDPRVRELLSKDGKIYGVPRDGYALGMFINIPLFKQAGLMDGDIPKYPKTMQELAETAKIIKEKTGKAGFVMLSKDNSGGWHFSNIAWAFGAELQVQENGKWKANLNSKEAVEAMQFVKDLKWKYNALTDEILQDWSSGMQAIGTGNAAMYFAAQDAISVPTKDYGLPKDDIALVPMPAGPGGQYSLMGGTPYMFSATATPEEIDAALKFLEIMGRAPVLNEDTEKGLEDDAKYRKDNGIPVIPSFQVWTNKDYINKVEEVRKNYENINYNLYKDYFEISAKTLRTEEPNLTQDMYAELYPIIQEVLTNENADIQQLLDKANSNFQQKLDASVNQ